MTARTLDMENSGLIVEVGTEEIPASMLAEASQQLALLLLEGLRAERLECRIENVWYTPRRLVVVLRDLPQRQKDLVETIIGPPRRVSFDAGGAPTQAALAFAQKHAIPVSRTRVVQTPKGEYLSVERNLSGEDTRRILPRIIPAAIAGIQFPKTMYWTSDKFRFARPIRWALALYQDRPVSFRVAGLQSSRFSRGHRFIGRARIPIPSLSRFADLLAENGVMVDPEERRKKISSGLAREAASAGGDVLEDPALLQIVTNLNECPSVIRGSFEESFLELPQEILITVMREHQKYFAVLDGQGRLLPSFLAVINLESDPEGVIRAGHERVLRARLADADFFWKMDRKVPLLEREGQLKNVVYQEKLGSYYEKTQRILTLLPRLAGAAGCSGNLADLMTAGRLLKCDLVTDMVKEFTDLQGIVGGLYARAEGYPEPVWRGIYEQYQPGSSNAASPSTLQSAVLALADRLDSVCGCFSVGLIPSGSKDPFAVRRQGNGILKIILDHHISISLQQMIGWGFEALGVERRDTAVEILKFFEGRLRFLLGEMGYAYDCINAAFAAGFDDALDALERVRALQAIRPEEDFLALASSFKRIANILNRAEAVTGAPDRSVLCDPAEIDLLDKYEALKPVIRDASRRRDYELGLRSLASMRGAVDSFFDKVLVMAEDPVVRTNRLLLLRGLVDLFLGVADISQIVIEQSS